jgi:hypothetical protein
MNETKGLTIRDEFRNPCRRSHNYKYKKIQAKSKVTREKHSLIN